MLSRLSGFINLITVARVCGQTHDTSDFLARMKARIRDMPGMNTQNEPRIVTGHHPHADDDVVAMNMRRPYLLTSFTPMGK